MEKARERRRRQEQGERFNGRDLCCASDLSAEESSDGSLGEFIIHNDAASDASAVLGDSASYTSSTQSLSFTSGSNAPSPAPKRRLVRLAKRRPKAKRATGVAVDNTSPEWLAAECRRAVAKRQGRVIEDSESGDDIFKPMCVMG